MVNLAEGIDRLIDLDGSAKEAAGETQCEILWVGLRTILHRRALAGTIAVNLGADGGKAGDLAGRHARGIGFIRARRGRLGVSVRHLPARSE